MNSLFRELLLEAKQGDKDSRLEIIEMYRPLMIKSAMVNGQFDEDLYQEYVYIMLLCIMKFPVNNLKSRILDSEKGD